MASPCQVGSTQTPHWRNAQLDFTAKGCQASHFLYMCQHVGCPERSLQLNHNSSFRVESQRTSEHDERIVIVTRCHMRLVGWLKHVDIFFFFFCVTA